MEKASAALFEEDHDFTTKEGIVKLLAASAIALLHDVPGMSVKKANVLTLQGSVILRAISANQ